MSKQSQSDRYITGMTIRRKILGDDHVDRAEAKKTAFDAPFQTLITETAWGNVWASDGVSDRERSMLTLALLAAHPTLMKRPVVEKDGQVWLGWGPEVQAAVLA